MAASQVVLYKILQVALSVSPALTLPIALDGFRVDLPILAGIIGISSAPFLLAVPADLVVLGVGVELIVLIASRTVGVVALHLNRTQKRHHCT